MQKKLIMRNFEKIFAKIVRKVNEILVKVLVNYIRTNFSISL